MLDDDRFSPEDARHRLEDELSDPKYQREFAGPIREAIDQIMAWMNENLSDATGLRLPYGEVIAVILVVIGVVVAVMLLRPRLHTGRRAEQPVEIDPGISAQQLRSQAVHYAESGQVDAGFRDMFRAVVRGAEERGVLRDQAGRTATEIADALGEQFGTHRAELERTAERFNLTLYGGRRLHARDFEHLEGLERALRDTALAGERSGDGASDGTDDRAEDQPLAAPQ